MGNVQAGIIDLQEASRDKATSEHAVIDEAIREQGDGYTVFSIPVGVLYRPNERKMKNSQARDYMGKARLVAASDASDAFTGFTGVTRLKMGITPTNTFVQPDGPGGGGLARANTTLPPKSVPVVEAPSGLARSKTTQAIASAPMERERSPPPADSDQTAFPPARGPGLGRSTSLRTSPGAGGPAPVRGLSVRKPPVAGTTPALSVPVPESRMTEFYDDYIDSYGERDQPPLPPLPSMPSTAAKMEKISAWAQDASPARQPIAKRGAPASNYAPSSYGGGRAPQRKLTRRGTGRSRAGTNAPSMYEEEEEGYGSGSEDPGFELVKIRVKVRSLHSMSSY